MPTTHADAFTKKHQCPVLIKDMKLALLIRLIEWRTHTLCRQVFQTRPQAFVQGVDSVDVDIEGLAVTQRSPVQTRRTFQ